MDVETGTQVRKLIDLSPQAEHAQALRIHPKPQAARKLAARHERAHANADDVLAHADFLMALSREMRRVERTRSPLSLVLFRFEGDPPRQDAASDGLLRLMQADTRETDVIACLDDDSIAVLCPDTSDQGLNDVIRKLKARDADAFAQFAHRVATYPDALFELLAAGTSPHAMLTPFASCEHGGGYALKRSLDVVGAVLAIALFSPVMLMVAAMVKLGSPGPAIFRQQRLGQGGAAFTFYKFRSMRTDADDGIHRQYVAQLINAPDAQAAMAGGAPATFKLAADPRITPIGRFIRRTSIDELPQLFNVLRGDMSLVGPRPPLAYEVAQYRPWHLRRILAGKPGLTGLWQVEGRSRVPFDDMVRMDLRYRRECSLRLDLKILCKTVLVVLRCKGAV